MEGTKIYIQSYRQKQRDFYSDLFAYLRKYRHKIPFPGWKKLLDGLLAISEPAGRVTVYQQPVFTDHRNCGEIKILSANLWHDFPYYRNLKERTKNFARLVEETGADILLLQEVTRILPFHADEWLADELGMAYIYSRANGHDLVGFEEGLGIYSRFPLGSPVLMSMPGGFGPLIRRIALGAPIYTPCGELFTFSVHLSTLPIWNRLQIFRLQEWVKNTTQGNTALIGGDFNTFENTKKIRNICGKWMDTFRYINPQADGVTYESHWPWGGKRRVRLDYVFLKQEKPGWIVIDSQHIYHPNNPHSDHHAVLTRLEPNHQPK